MSHSCLIVLAAVITFASRISFMIRPLPDTRVKESRFLEVFPTALFLALAVNGFVAPDGNLDLSPAIAAGVGGIAGAVCLQAVGSRGRRRRAWSATGSPV